MVKSKPTAQAHRPSSKELDPAKSTPNKNGGGSGSGNSTLGGPSTQMKHKVLVKKGLSQSRDTSHKKIEDGEDGRDIGQKDIEKEEDKGEDEDEDEESEQIGSKFSDHEHVQPSTQVITGAGKRKKSHRKAGGTGKKGKVFLEDKADLLSLMDTITTAKDSIVSSKIAKDRLRQAQAALRAEAKGKKKGQTGDGSGRDGKSTLNKAEERAKALDRAKKEVLERQREKKRKRRQGGTRTTESTSPITKKRVGFA